MWPVIVFVLPLCVDSFVAAAAVGAGRGLSGWARLRVAAVFCAFEAGMPLVGLGLGQGLARAVGEVAGYLAAAAVIAVGGWLLLEHDDEQDRAGRLGTARGLAVLGLGLSVGLDELAIGFGLGLTRLPLVPVIVAIALQALAAAWLGLTLGARVGARFRENAERVAALALIAIGIVLLVSEIRSAH